MGQNKEDEMNYTADEYQSIQTTPKQRWTLPLEEGKVDEEGCPKQRCLHRDIKVLGEPESAFVTRVKFVTLGMISRIMNGHHKRNLQTLKNLDWTSMAI